MTVIKKINHSTGYRLLIAFGIGILAWLGAQALGAGAVSLLVGWDVAASIFIVWILAIILPMNNERTSEFAVREDPTKAGADIVLILASIASLGAIGVAMLSSNQLEGATRLLVIGLCLVSVVISWLLVHIIYTLRYAMLYYSKEVSGSIEFGGGHVPAYSDFMYIAFTVGMTFQVSDTGLNGTSLRRTVLRHALLSYMFGTVIVATTINLIGGLTR